MSVEGQNLSLFSDNKILTSSKINKVENFHRLFIQIHNFIYANEGLSPQEALNEFIKILFIKVEDENKRTENFYISPEEASSVDRSNKKFIARINSIFEQAKTDYPSLFDSSDKIRLKSSTLSFVVEKLQGVKISQEDHDVKGIAFQKFVFSSQRGDRGQFFTPDPIIRLCAEFLRPKITDKILDPAAGTAGFLIEAMRFVLKSNANEKQKKQFISKNLFGIEISPTLARIAKMRMILEGDGHSGIVNTDSLSNIAVLKQVFAQQANVPDIHEYFDLILTNPPFGTQGKITNPNVLKGYSLAYKWVNDDYPSSTMLNGQVPEIMFIERCLSLLKPGGKLAIVLPNGEFENMSLQYVRNFIKSQANLLAVVSLPQETFIPHGTAVKASVLFIRKKKSKGVEKEEEVFFAKINKVGYKGDKNGTVLYKRDSKGTVVKGANGNPVIDEDVTEVIQKYKDFKDKNIKLKNRDIFVLPEKTIINRFDVEFYSPEYTELFKKLLSRNSFKLGEVASIVRKKSDKLRDPSTEINYIELSDVNPVSSEITNSTNMKAFEAPSRAYYEIEAGDIITAVAGNSVGTKNHVTALVKREHAGSICTNGFRVLRPTKVNAEYLLIFLKSNLFLTQMYQLRTGAAIPAVSESDLSKVLIPMPSDEQQTKISKKVRKSLELREQSNKIILSAQELIGL